MEYMKKKIAAVILIGFFAFLFSTAFLLAKQPVNALSATTWKIQSIDTMKYSRDGVRDSAIVQNIPLFVQEVAALKANYIAIDTPYDEEFHPVLTSWVTAARKNNLHVWFRGNFSSWEGWFNYPQMKDPNEDHVLVKSFILQHPDLFQDGDIFTPVPEPENGVIGDPRTSDQKAKDFNTFLIASYNNCVASFQQIHKQVTCGYFSMNGDVASTVLTQQTVKQIGNTIVIDHYVDSPEKMGEKIDELSNTFHAQIVIGEFGGPIPDINGDMTDTQQADFVGKLLDQIYSRRSVVTGLNYWVLGGGSTALLNDDFTPRPVAQVLKNYYSPNVWHAQIIDAFNDPISYAHVVANTDDAVSIQNGIYTIVTKKDAVTVTIQVNGYQKKVATISFADNQVVNQAIVLTPSQPDFWYKVQLLWQKMFH